MPQRWDAHRSINITLFVATLLASWITATPALAIGPHNVLIITGENSLEALTIANYYREKRGIPAVNVVRLPSGLTTSAHIDYNVFRTYFMDAVKKHIERYSLKDRIAVWTTTPAMPHVVQGENGLSGLIYFGKFQVPSKDPRAPGTFEDRNKYFDQMRAFGAPDGGEGGYLHMRLDAGSLEGTKLLIDRSIRADGSFPKGTVYFSEGEGPRASRRDMIAPAMQWLEMMHIKSIRKPGASLTGADNVIGWQTGIATLNPALNTYLPGALADHLTSFGGQLTMLRGQTPAIEFIKAGCSATYGTVAEPYNYPAKFPLPQLFVFYGMGFTAVESYWQSVLWPQQGVFIGDPLTRPFDASPKITVNGVSANQEVKGSFEFDVIGETDRKEGGVQRIEVYIDRRLVHQRGFNDLPAGTSVSFKIGDKTITQKADRESGFGEFVGAFGQAIAKTGVKVASKPGFLILLLPKKPKEGDLAIRSSSDLLAVHLLSDQAENRSSSFPSIEEKPKESDDSLPFQSSAPPLDSKMEWELSGVSGTGDRLVLTISEEGKEIAKYEHTIEFPRPASSVCTSVWLDASSKLPKGYRLKSSLTPDKPNQGKLLLTADASRARSNPTATLHLKRSADSGMSIVGQKADMPEAKEEKPPTTPLVLSGSLAAIRFGVGPAKLETRPIIDTASIPDGLHTLEIIAVRGSITEASSRWAAPIVIRNGEAKMVVEPIKTELSFKEPGRVEVALAKLPPGVGGFVKYFIDDVEAPPQDLKDGKLLVSPQAWGPGRHSVTARVFQGMTEVLFSDNEVIFTVTP